jgi:hypothetical protein
MTHENGMQELSRLVAKRADAESPASSLPLRVCSAGACPRSDIY